MLSFSAEEESVQVKPRARSTASGKKIPAGAISIFGGIFFQILFENDWETGCYKTSIFTFFPSSHVSRVIGF